MSKNIQVAHEKVISPIVLLSAVWPQIRCSLLACGNVADSVCVYLGVSGNILIPSSANRLNSYDVWEYSDGHDDFYIAMLVDLTQPRDKVSRLSHVTYFAIFNTVHTVLKASFTYCKSDVQY